MLSPLVNGYDFIQGDRTYATATATASDQISKEYGFQFNITTILLAAKDENQYHYKAQWKQLDKLDAEALQLIYVTSKVDSISESGYHTSTETAEEILNGAVFRVVVISSSGNELVNQETAMTSSQLLSLLKRNE